MTMELAPEPTLSARGISSSSSPISTINYFTDSQQLQYHSSSSSFSRSPLLGYHLPPSLLAARVANTNTHTDLLLSVPSSRSLFTPEQWVELTQQTYVYKHLAAGVIPPVALLIPIISSVSALSRLASSSNRLGGTPGGFHPGLLLRGAADSEPGRCRRTDGKKWRCAREVVLDHKYCEKHVHRGRHRARGKTATSIPQPQPQPPGAPTSADDDALSKSSGCVTKLTGSDHCAPFPADNSSVHSSLCSSPAVSRETCPPVHDDGRRKTFRFVGDSDGLSRLFQGRVSRQLHATSVVSSGENNATGKTDNFFDLLSTGGPVPKWLNVARNRGDDLAALAKSSGDRTSDSPTGPNYQTAPFPFNNIVEPDNLAAAASKTQREEQAVAGWPRRASEFAFGWGPGGSFSGSRASPPHQLLLPSDLSMSTLTASPLRTAAGARDNGDEEEEEEDGMSLSMAVGAAVRSEESVLPPSWVPIAWDSPIAGGPLAEVLQPPLHHLADDSWAINAAANVNKRCKFAQPSGSLASPTEVLNVASSFSECTSSSSVSSPRSSSTKALTTN